MRSVFILGYGVEGQAASRYFNAHHPDVSATVIDQHSPEALLPGQSWLSEEEALAALTPETQLLRSPGVRPDHPLVEAALARGAKVTTPTGYWLEHHAPKGTITVTGTKGKSSTVALLSFLLEKLGVESLALGNIGAPPLDAQLPTAAQPVIELSSYMMHDLPLTGHLHMITSLYKEHIPWHGDEQRYRAAKLRPFLHQPPAPGYAPAVVMAAEGLRAPVQALEDVVPLEGEQLAFGKGRLHPATLNDRFTSPGELLALRAACVVALNFVDTEALIEVLRTHLPEYRGLAHRQEEVPTTDGRLWVNDALATVPEAVEMALYRWAGRPITLLLGGAYRGQDFTKLAEAMAGQGQVTSILFGSIAPKAAGAFITAAVPFQQTEDFFGALAQAPDIAAKGSVILFSPGAASEAPHNNYKERAALFYQKAGEYT
ncbi:MAG: UDP-N-acetylmuramoyl-L-alanine--D-glutamate ligase [Pseudomonadota bacterium]